MLVFRSNSHNKSLKFVPRFAKERGIPRSQLFAEALEEYLAQHGPEAITAQLDRVYDSERSQLDEPFIRTQSAVLKDEAW